MSEAQTYRQIYAQPHMYIYRQDKLLSNTTMPPIEVQTMPDILQTSVYPMALLTSIEHKAATLTEVSDVSELFGSFLSFFAGDDSVFSGSSFTVSKVLRFMCFLAGIGDKTYE